MVDSGDLKSPGHCGRAGSSPAPGTMNFRTLARNILRSLDQHEPLVVVSISKENLLHNLHSYKSRYPKLSFAPVLKSNAYGHGLITIAQLLDNQDIAFFMVDSYFEARALRHAGVRSRIVILGYVRPQEIASSQLLNVDYAVVDLEQLHELAHIANSPIRVHLKVDTGMHRHGLMPEQLDEAIRLAKSNKNLQVVGVCSHFADADNPDPTHTRAQIKVWSAAVEKLAIAFPSIEYRHIAATKGVPISDETDTNVARLGIGLYGFDTSPDGAAPLKPVLEMCSIVTSVREVPAGEFVGYNATYTTPKPMKIATVPAGYFEGVDRRLSNKGSVLVNGIACPIVGRVSMNMTGVNLTEMSNVKIGDEVVLVSRDPGKPNSVSNIAKLCSSSEYRETEYVILSHIPQHLRRVVE